MLLTTEQKQFICEHEHDNVHKLALSLTRDDKQIIISQIVGRQIAAKKFSSWLENDNIIYPPHISLEQASSQTTAQYKASLLPKLNSFADLTGGMGVDFAAFAPMFSQSIYVEQNAELCRIAAHNFAALNLAGVEIRNSDSETFMKETANIDFVYCDPARRDNMGRKVFRISDCSPDLSQMAPLLIAKSKIAMIKYSPMLDLSSAIKTLAGVSHVHIVSVDNECRELLFILAADAAGEPPITTVNLKKTGNRQLLTFTVSDEQQTGALIADKLGKYLYEPNASVMKAGAFKTVANRYETPKLHINSHLYTSDRIVADFPGRAFEIIDSCTTNKRQLKPFLDGITKANIATRNFPETVAEIRRKTNIKEGGDTYLFATTIANESKVWIKCRKVQLD